MKRVLTIFLVGILVLGLASFAFAYNGKGSMQGREGNRSGMMRNRDDLRRGLEQLQERLNLSDQQMEKIEALQDKYFDQFDDISDRLREKSDDLKDTYFDSDVNEEEIIALQKEVNQLKNELANLRLKKHLEMKEILTAEQLEDMGQQVRGGFGMNRRAGGRGRRMKR